MTDHQPDKVEFSAMPGHLVRRLHQVQMALFAQGVAPLDLPPMQFAALAHLQAHPGCGQASLGRAVACDPVTIGGVLLRLEKKAWVRRSASPQDQRKILVYPTAAGLKTLAQAHSRVAEVQAQLLQPLTPAQRTQFMKLLHQLLKGHLAEPGD